MGSWNDTRFDRFLLGTTCVKFYMAMFCFLTWFWEKGHCVNEPLKRMQSPSGNTFDGREPLESGTVPSFSPQPDTRDCGMMTI